MSKSAVVYTKAEIEDAIDELRWKNEILENYALASAVIKSEYDSRLKEANEHAKRYGIPFVAPEYCPDPKSAAVINFRWSTSSLEC